MGAGNRGTHLVLVAGLVLATSLPVGWWSTRPPAEEGAWPPAGVSAAAPPSTRAEVATGRGPRGREDTDGGQASAEAPDDAVAVPTRPSRVGDLGAPPAGAEPARLSIPELDVEAPVEAVGVADDGEMQVPTDVDRVGWYRHGPAPGEAGATVLASHVDGRGQGRGVFFGLRGLGVGDAVDLVDHEGERHGYDVVARRSFDKHELPLEELFSRTGPHRLVLITCGGDFDSQTGSYSDNVVVHAVPSDPKPGG